MSYSKAEKRNLSAFWCSKLGRQLFAFLNGFRAARKFLFAARCSRSFCRRLFENLIFAGPSLHPWCVSWAPLIFIRRDGPACRRVLASLRKTRLKVQSTRFAQSFACPPASPSPIPGETAAALLHILRVKPIRYCVRNSRIISLNA